MSEDADSLFYLGSVYRDEGLLEQAHELFSRGLNALELEAFRMDFTEEIRSRHRAKYSQSYQDAIAVALATDRFEEAFHFLERYRAQSLLKLLRWGRSEPIGVDPEHREKIRRYDAITLELDRFVSGADESEKAELRKEQAEILRYLQKRMAARIQTTDGETLLTPLTADEVRRSLEKGTTLLAYSVTHQGTHLFLVTSDGLLEAATLPITSTDLWLRARRFRDLLQTIDITGPRSKSLEETAMDKIQSSEARLETGRWLYDQLIAPAAEHVKGAKRLLILPDGPLYYVPFAAFIRPADENPADWHYLVEWKPIHTVQSVTVYAELKKRRPDSGALDLATARTLVALGDPSYPPVHLGTITTPAAEAPAEPVDDAFAALRSAEDRGLFEGLTDLPQTKREVEQIGRLFKQSPYLDDRATEEIVKTGAQKARYLHIAAHGFADPDENPTIPSSPSPSPKT